MTNPRNARSTSTGRVYQWGREEFVSVTTVLNGGIPKPALTNWAAKMAAEFAVTKRDKWVGIADVDERAAVDLIKGAPWRDRDKASNKGSLVHEYAEAKVSGLPLPELPPEIVGYANSFLKWWEDWGITPDDYAFAEATVYNRTFGYAGSFDVLFGERFGWTLSDYKTARSGIFPETALQLCAYKNAEFIGLPDGTEIPMPPTADEGWGIHIAPRSYKVVPLRLDDEAFDTFLAALKVNKWTSGKGYDKMGAPLAPPREDAA